jgi:hypothetical protein
MLSMASGAGDGNGSGNPEGSVGAGGGTGVGGGFGGDDNLGSRLERGVLLAMKLPKPWKKSARKKKKPIVDTKTEASVDGEVGGGDDDVDDDDHEKAGPMLKKKRTLVWFTSKSAPKKEADEVCCSLCKRLKGFGCLVGDQNVEASGGHAAVESKAATSKVDSMNVDGSGVFDEDTDVVEESQHWNGRCDDVGFEFVCNDCDAKYCKLIGHDFFF